MSTPMVLHVHRVDRETYDAQPGDEIVHEGTTWKNLTLPGIRIVMFPVPVEALEEMHA